MADALLQLLSELWVAVGGPTPSLGQNVGVAPLPTHQLSFPGPGSA